MMFHLFGVKVPHLAFVHYKFDFIIWGAFVMNLRWMGSRRTRSTVQLTSNSPAFGKHPVIVADTFFSLLKHFELN